MKKIIFLVLISTAMLLSLKNVSAQSSSDLYNQAMKLKAEYHNQEALAAFQRLLKSDSNNVNYLQYGSAMYSKVGHEQSSETEQNTYYKTAEFLALKAIKINDNSADAHYAYALALGRLNEHASNKQKIAYAKLIKTEVDKSIQLNPNHAGAYHILGRWNRTIAEFNSFQKMAINTLYGGLPTGTYEAAVSAFKKAISIEPNYMLHQYELAVTYHEMGNDAEAKVWAQHALTLPVTNNDDKVTQANCQDLLKKLK
ncbi:MAG: hypothetical protein ABI199_02285 [Bacteroidia bacterium]